MPSIAAATATIHFIGIILFANDNGIHAIMPKIPDVPERRTELTYATKDFKPDLNAYRVATPHELHSAQQTTPPAPGAAVSNAIDAHTALIAFRTSEKIYSAWPVVALNGKNAGWSYVELHGEELTFDTLSLSVTNPTPSQNPQLPKLKSVTSSQAPPLTARFKPPYSGAAGVIDIPRGVLSSCTAFVIGHGDTTRADTKLSLNHSGLIVIRMSAPSADPSKVIVLKPNHEIYVANAPMQWITSFGQGNGSPDHWHAYYQMTNEPTNNNQPKSPMPNATCVSQFIPPHGGGGDTPNGTSEFVHVRAMGSPTPPPPSDDGEMGTLVSNAECSNTQWP